MALGGRAIPRERWVESRLTKPSEDVRLRTVEDIVRGYDHWIVVRRWGGAWIDFLVLASMLLVPDWILGNDLYIKTIVVWLGLVVLYFPLAEGLTGYSLGKIVTRTKVVTIHGKLPGVWKASIRSLLRLVEVNPFLVGGIPAGIAVACSKRRQRLGDMAAGTFVLTISDLRAFESGGTPASSVHDPWRPHS